ncbi:MAG: N-acetylmuramoyl-L-alanine amidase [Desulfovibrionales bacterium]
MIKDEKRAKFRSSWMAVKKYFWSAYNANTSGSYAPKSLYYLGRVYQELGKRSWVKQDFITAADYFQRVVSRFPRHSWADDAQLHKAKIQLKYLKNEPQAYIDLLHIIHNYPKGDMYADAQDLLRTIDQTHMQKNGKPAVQTAPVKEKRAAKAAPSSGNTSMARLDQIRHWSSDDYTRVVLDLDGEVNYSYKLLKPDPDLGTPHRLFLDLSTTRLSNGTDTKYTISDGILRQVRSGQNTSDQARVVLDIQHLDNYRIFALENPFRIVVDVYASKRQPSAASSQESGSNPLDVGKNVAGSLVEQLGLTVQTVMLDAGHGGKDPGAVCDGIYEKDINLQVVKHMGRMLEAKGFKVLYTRTTDVFLPLDERTAMANMKKADLFISVHTNAHPNRNVSGFELYYLNLAKTQDAVRVAARENAVSVKKISDLQVILTDLMLNSKIKESSKLATDVHTIATGVLKKSYPDFQDHGVREAPFYVLMGAKMPAVLVELGYLTNKADAARLQSDAYQRKMAQALVDGIAGYKQRIERFASTD